VEKMEGNFNCWKMYDEHKMTLLRVMGSFLPFIILRRLVGSRDEFDVQLDDVDAGDNVRSLVVRFFDEIFKRKTPGEKKS